jgi:hypothetical protein
MTKPVAFSPKLTDFLDAAERSVSFHEAEAERLKDHPNWQQRWRAQEKARAAALVVQAVLDAITSESNLDEDHNNRA